MVHKHLVYDKSFPTKMLQHKTTYELIDEGMDVWQELYMVP